MSSRGAARADLTVVADNHLPPLDARQRLVVRNAPEWALLPPPTTPDPAPRAIYIGDVRASRGLFDMLSAIAGAPGWQLDIVGPVAAADVAGLAAALERHDLAGRVRCHGRLKPESAWEFAKGAWVGLALLHDTPAFRDAVPAKLDEYFATGLPVIVSDLPRPAAIVQHSGAGAVVHSPVEAADFLRDLVDSPVLLKKVRDAAAARRAALVESRSPYAELATHISSLLEHPDHRRKGYGRGRPS
jgi:glycosyltransferase involved in cell wall biosynthesis